MELDDLEQPFLCSQSDGQLEDPCSTDDAIRTPEGSIKHEELWPEAYRRVTEGALEVKREDWMFMLTRMARTLKSSKYRLMDEITLDPRYR